MEISVNYVSPKEALSVTQSSQRVFIHGSAHTPTYLLEYLFKRHTGCKMLKLSVRNAVHAVQVSPPDSHGYCSLGVSVDIARSAVNTARYVIAQVNPNAPRTPRRRFGALF